MKIAIVGGGLTGIVCAYFLSQDAHSVTLFESDRLCGGLASGFISNNWDWPLDRVYHHIFSNDYDILDFSNKIGYSGFVFTSPQTASLYNSRIFPVDTPQDFLRLPLLSIPDKLRAGAVLAFLKYSPFFSLYEKETAHVFLKKTMGDRAWIVLWEELFRKKFGKYAEKIVASFIWARIAKRTKELGYPTGGFQSFVNHIVNLNINQGVNIKTNSPVTQIKKTGKRFIIDFLESGAGKLKRQDFDVVVSTLPTPVLINIGGSLFNRAHIDKLKKIRYLSAVNLILETDTPILEKTYWLNICDSKVPIMCIVQHTNLVNKSRYHNNHLSYVANYVEDDDWRLSASKEEIIKQYLPYLKVLNSQFVVLHSYFFKTPYAQPIYDQTFIQNRPEIASPVKNLYIANMEMTYPYDRGTNYAVRLGKQVAKMI